MPVWAFLVVAARAVLRRKRKMPDRIRGSHEVTPATFCVRLLYIPRHNHTFVFMNSFFIREAQHKKPRRNKARTNPQSNDEENENTERGAMYSKW